MAQIGTKEIEKIKSDIERGDYDLEKCMSLRNSKLRVELARHGRHVDMLAERNEPRVLVALIEHGYAESYYDTWKTHENGDVRRALAKRGYYPEVFIRDKNESVRHATFNQYPEMIRELLSQNNWGDWSYVKSLIREHPTPELVIPFVEMASPFGASENDVLYVYAKAYQTDVDTIRSTMTSKQLFALNDPHWVLSLPYNVASILHQYRQTLAEQGRLDELIAIYDDVFDGKLINWGPLERLATQLD